MDIFKKTEKTKEYDQIRNENPKNKKETPPKKIGKPTTGGASKA
jgi:hypothetical protein